MGDRQRLLAEAILKDPDVLNVQSFVGVDGQNQTLNEGRVLIALKPLGQRNAGASEIIRRLQPGNPQNVAGITALHAAGAGLDHRRHRVSRTQYQFVLEGTDPTELNEPRRTKLRLQAARPCRTWSRCRPTPQNQGLAAYVNVDRSHTAGRLGVSMASDRQLALRRLRPGDRLHHLHPVQPIPGDPGGHALDPAVGRRPAVHLPASPRRDGQVPLSAIATIKPAALAASLVSHVGQFPAATISFNLPPRAWRSAQPSNQIKHRPRPIDRGADQSITTTFLGAAQAFQSSLSNELWLILAAVVAIYIVLGVLYESFIHPLTILSTLPSAAIGALLALLLTGQDLGVIGIIAIVLLFGIVKKNAIMMIDFALDAERNEGLSPTEAIHQAALLRFRPIMMTTMAALLGALPLMLGGGMGSELRFPLGVAIVGGLLGVPAPDPVHNTGDLHRLRQHRDPLQPQGSGEPGPL